MRILVVDDEADSLDHTVKLLESAGFEVVSFADALLALDYFYTCCHQIDAAILDYKLPRLDGLTFAKRILRKKPDCPIVLVSQYAGLGEFERGYGVGIRDFIHLPCSSVSFLERIHKALDVSLKKTESRILNPDIALAILGFDPIRRTIYWFGQSLKLTKKEVILLCCLVEAGKYMTYADIYLALYGERLSTPEAAHHLRALLIRLRKKLEAGGVPRIIESQRGSGFRWSAERLQKALRESVT